MLFNGDGCFFLHNYHVLLYRWLTLDRYEVVAVVAVVSGVLLGLDLQVVDESFLIFIAAQGQSLGHIA